MLMTTNSKLINPHQMNGQQQNNHQKEEPVSKDTRKETKKSPKLAVYTIIPSGTEDGKDFWQRIGSAFFNKDGSMNVMLNALPVNGKLHIREQKQEELK